MFTEFKEPFSRHGRLEGHEINAQLKENCAPRQQKVRRRPLPLQNAVENELKKLIEMRHIAKINKIKDDVFIQSTVITVKRDKSMKTDLDVRVKNENKKKDKYQVSKLDDLLSTLAEKNTQDGDGEVWLTSANLK